MKKVSTLVVAVLILQALQAQVPSLNLVQIATGFTSPVDIQTCGDNRLFIVEQAGRIRIMSKSGVINATPFLDISSRVQSSGNEQGLLGLAFSPNFKQDGYFYVNYINGSSAGSTRISRFQVNPTDSNLALANSEVILLTFTQPYTNHNGGQVSFGPDGYLYDWQGDGGSGSDPQGNGQNKNTYLGKILRLDVSNHDTTFTIPPTNPFVGQANTQWAIWAYGVRNPWRNSFDRITNDLWIGDVGQDAYEEIDFQPASSTGGENYGWRCREGFHACPNCNTSGCPASTSFVDPIYEVPQANTSVCSITGGYVYRGTQYSRMWGLYFHSDFCTGRIWSIRNLGNNTFDADSPAVAVNGTTGFLTNNVGTFGQDNNGELYIAGRSNGRIYHITERIDCNPVAFISLQDTLTGCIPVTVSALRGDTLAYQWYNSNGIINGATSYQYAAAQSGWYKVKVSKTLHAGCEAVSDSVYVLVRDTAVLTPGTGSHIFCENDNAVSLNSYVSPSGGTYAGLGVSNNTFNPAQVNVASTSLGYTYTNQYSCVSHAAVTMQVDDTTALTKNNINSLYCLYDAPSSLAGFYNFQGTYTGSGVGNDNVTFTPATAGVGTAALNFAYTNIDGCISSSAFNVAVGDTTAITGTTAAMMCRNNGLVTLNYLSPAGGTYSGNAVNNNVFNALQLSGHTATLAYVYTNTFGCVSHASVFVQVNDTTTLTKNNLDTTSCVSDTPFSLTGFFTYPGAYSGNGVANDDSTFSPASAGAGVIPISYEFMDIEGCRSHATFNLLVNGSTALVNNGGDTVACTNETAFSLTSYISPTGGTYSGTGVSGGNFDPAAAGAGNHTVYYNYTNANSCLSRDSFTIAVSACGGINEPGKGLSFNIYPNPGKGDFYLTTNGNVTGAAELQIMDVLGKVCHKETVTLNPAKVSVSISCPQLAKGTYSVQLRQGVAVAVKSLVVE